MLDGTVPTVERWETTLDELLLLVRLLGEDTRAGLARMGLTESRAHVLLEIEHRGASTQRTLAEALKVAPRTITTLVDALVETGFVTREPHPTDRRATLVTLTSAGQRATRSLVEDHQRLAWELFADVAPETMDGFVAGLAHVIAELSAKVDATDPR